MTSTERAAHAIVGQMSIGMKARFKDFVVRGRLSKESQAEFDNRSLITLDEYGSWKLTDTGGAAMAIIDGER